LSSSAAHIDGYESKPFGLGALSKEWHFETLSLKSWPARVVVSLLAPNLVVPFPAQF